MNWLLYWIILIMLVTISNTVLLAEDDFNRIEALQATHIERTMDTINKAQKTRNEYNSKNNGRSVASYTEKELMEYNDFNTIMNSNDEDIFNQIDELDK